MVAILKTLPNHFLGAGMQGGELVPVQDHHGAGLWVLDTDGWLLFMGLAGVEWSAQFCADPAKVDRLRQYAARLLDAFPLTLPEYERLGYHEGATILAEPIIDAAGVARWTDSIFNASVPLPADAHTGVLPKRGGRHHYPAPITDIDFVRRDDFRLWVTDGSGKPVAVAPVAARGSGDGRVRVLYAEPGSVMHPKLAALHSKGQALVLSAEHPLAQQAFAQQ